MATNGITAIGSTVTFGSLVGEIGSMSPSGRSCNVIPIFSTDSSNGFVEKIAGQLDDGEVTLDVVYDGTAAGVYNDLDTAYLAKTVQSLTITYSDASTFVNTAAFISSIDKPGFSAADGEVRFSVTFVYSGKSTYTDVA